MLMLYNNEWFKKCLVLKQFNNWCPTLHIDYSIFFDHIFGVLGKYERTVNISIHGWFCWAVSFSSCVCFPSNFTHEEENIGLIHCIATSPTLIFYADDFIHQRERIGEYTKLILKCIAQYFTLSNSTRFHMSKRECLIH